MSLTLPATFQVTNSSARSSLCPDRGAVSITRLFLGYYLPLWDGTWWEAWNWYKSKKVCNEQIEIFARFGSTSFAKFCIFRSENKQVEPLRFARTLELRMPTIWIPCVSQANPYIVMRWVGLAIIKCEVSTNVFTIHFFLHYFKF